MGMSAMRYFLSSATMTLSMESTSSSISALYLERACSDVMTAAWDSTMVPTSLSLFILSVDPVETRSTM